MVVDYGGDRIWSGGLSPQILSCCKILSTRLLALQCRQMCFCFYSRTFIVSLAMHPPEFQSDLRLWLWVPIDSPHITARCRFVVLQGSVKGSSASRFSKPFRWSVRDYVLLGQTRSATQDGREHLISRRINVECISPMNCYEPWYAIPPRVIFARHNRLCSVTDRCQATSQLITLDLKPATYYSEWVSNV